jgi:hypothetical protein
MAWHVCFDLHQHQVALRGHLSMASAQAVQQEVPQGSIVPPTTTRHGRHLNDQKK